MEDLPPMSLLGFAWMLLSFDVDRGAGPSLAVTVCLIALNWKISFGVE